MTELRWARNELEQLLPHYAFADPNDERAAYFRGLMKKTVDSLSAVEMLVSSSGPIWTHHCRWIIEAFGYAAALNENPKVLDEIKRLGAKKYFLVVGVDDAEARDFLDSAPLKIGTGLRIGYEFQIKHAAWTYELTYRIWYLLPFLCPPIPLPGNHSYIGSTAWPGTSTAARHGARSRTPASTSVTR